MSSFRGVGTALVTPFRADGALDEDALRKLVDWQIAEGINFLVPCGTTGENPALNADEHQRVVEITIRTANKRVPVLAGAGSNNTPRAVELARQALDLGADGILTVTPYYNKPTPDGLLRHFGAQAAAIGKLPMILYNVPGRTGLNMTAETTLRIAREIPNVIGVKEASGNMEQILAILRDRPKGFLVLSGDDAWTLPLLGVGSDGVVSVASNEVPRLMRQMVDGRDVAIHNRLLPLLTGNFIESNPGPVKFAMKAMGVLDSDIVRAPLAQMSEGSQAKMLTILKECGLME